MREAEEEMNRKRRLQEFDEEENDFLELSLAYGPRKISKGTTYTEPTAPPSPPPLLQPEVQQLTVPSDPILQTQFSPHNALQVSPTHSLLSVFGPEGSSSASLLYPQEPVQPLPSSLPPLPPSPPAPPSSVVSGNTGSGRSVRVRRNPTQSPREGKSDTVPPPFPWATTHRATVHSLNYLLSKQIFTISGEVQCKRCERQYEIAYDLKERFAEIGSFIAENKNAMHDRAPSVWMNPALPKCKFCDQENSAKPVIAEKKKSINWLFLLLGQMLGCCTLEQLKYFCKHTKNHRTGAKDRVLYLTYLGLCKQLDPNGPFTR